MPIGREEALSLALGALRRGNDPWYTRDHLGIGLVRAGGLWLVTCSASPIAGGGGSAKVDADTGEVVDIRLPVGSR